MARQALIEVDACTFCYARDKSDVPATREVNFAFTPLDGEGNYALSYIATPTAKVKPTYTATACEADYQKISGKFVSFGEAVAGIAGMIQAEENPEPEPEQESTTEPVAEPEKDPALSPKTAADLAKLLSETDLGEDGNHDPGMDEDDAEAVRGHLANGATGMVGTKLVGGRPVPDRGAAVVPGQVVDPDDVDMSQPDPEEKIPAKHWYNVQTAAFKRKVKPPSDRGKWSNALIKAWRLSPEYQLWNQKQDA